MSLGLRIINEITEASPKESSLMLWDKIGVIGHFLSDTLTREPPGFFSMNDHYGDPIDEAELQKTNEDLDDSSNAAWTWSNDYRNGIWYFRPETEDLRGWGYVFWDKERLDDWRVLDEDQRLTERYRRPLLSDW